MKILGIDPGFKGGLCFLEGDKILEVIPMPIYEQKNGKNAIDLQKVIEFIKKYNPEVAYIEKVGAMRKQGVSSMFNFGFGTGCIHGICAGLNIPLKTVTPQKWKKTVLGEEYNHETKEGTVDFCKKQFPYICLLATKRSKVEHDGMSDACAITYYGFLVENNINSVVDGE